MSEDDLDRVLMEREEIVPSSGFVASVMEAVQQEAAAPAPIAFPWKWALPGLIVSVALALGLIVRWIYSGARVSHPTDATRVVLLAEDFLSMLPHGQVAASTLFALEWSALALVVSLAVIWLSMRIAGVKE